MSISLLLLLGLVTSVAANVEGLSNAESMRPLVAAHVKTRDVRHSLEDVMADAIGHEHKKASEVRMERLTEALRPLFTALPKNHKGNLGHSTVRYALHRHFVHSHGMYVKGFEPAGESWNNSSPNSVLEDKVPAYVQHLFEERLHEVGFDLKELALLAATLEHFIHKEAVSRLQVAYALSNLATTDDLKQVQLERVLDVYMLIYLFGASPDKLSPDLVARQLEQAGQVFPFWPETQNFMRDVQDDVLAGEEASTYTFEHASQIVTAIGERFGKHQDTDCRAMAKDLIAQEEKGSGRVKLPDFYKAGWQFKESKEYLQSLGAIDDSSTRNPRVIISNYMNSVTNCIASSTMYSVCCMDPCEELLGHVERRIGAHEASPEQLVDVVATLPSATVAAPRHLSVSLVKRLSEIADSHGGNVQLHGRLFAQWLHHAYPRECPFPAKSGTTKPLTADDWMKETNLTSTLSATEIDAVMSEAQLNQIKVKDLVDGDLEDTLPWLPEEELVFHKGSQPTGVAHELRICLRALAMVAALFSFAYAAVRNVVGVVGGASRKAIL